MRRTDRHRSFEEFQRPIGLIISKCGRGSHGEAIGHLFGTRCSEQRDPVDDSLNHLIVAEDTIECPADDSQFSVEGDLQPRRSLPSRVGKHLARTLALPCSELHPNESIGGVGGLLQFEEDRPADRASMAGHLGHGFLTEVTPFVE